MTPVPDEVPSRYCPPLFAPIRTTQRLSDELLNCIQRAIERAIADAYGEDFFGVAPVYPGTVAEQSSWILERNRQFMEALYDHMGVLEAGEPEACAHMAGLRLNLWFWEALERTKGEIPGQARLFRDLVDSPYLLFGVNPFPQWVSEVTCRPPWWRDFPRFRRGNLEVAGYPRIVLRPRI